MKRFKKFFVILFFLVHAVYPQDYLSSLEKNVLDEMNLARTNPKKYAEILQNELQYYDGKLIQKENRIAMRTREGKAAVKEAIAALLKTAALSPLAASAGMSLGARDHARDQSSGGTGHSGSDGSSPYNRINRYGKWQKTAGENISYGYNDGREVVLQLLIDDGVPSRGHRKNILNGQFAVTGIACGEHKTYKHLCVITYAGGFSEKKK